MIRKILEALEATGNGEAMRGLDRAGRETWRQSGTDLLRATGGWQAVQRGELLFEVALLESYRIILEVDEREIPDVRTGQPGELTLTALPDRGFPLIVERVTPVSTSADGKNFFRVEARLESPIDSLRPGMEGLAKIEAGRRSLMWIFTHKLTDWLHLFFWSWIP